jgi:hypothetical protein
MTDELWIGLIVTAEQKSRRMRSAQKASPRSMLGRFSIVDSDRLIAFSDEF